MESDSNSVCEAYFTNFLERFTKVIKHKVGCKYIQHTVTLSCILLKFRCKNDHLRQQPRQVSVVQTRAMCRGIGFSHNRCVMLIINSTCYLHKIVGDAKPYEGHLHVLIVTKVNSDLVDINSRHA